jgi:hypothetical protein
MNNTKKRYIIDVYALAAVVDGHACKEWQFATLASHHAEAEDKARDYEAEGFVVEIECP